MFTAEQSYVIYQNSKNVLLLARAGSGKTFTVANKIAESIKNGLKPEEVLCLTFTVKGAEELKEDVEVLTVVVTVYEKNGGVTKTLELDKDNWEGTMLTLEDMGLCTVTIIDADDKYCAPTTVGFEVVISTPFLPF